MFDREVVKPRLGLACLAWQQIRADQGDDISVIGTGSSPLLSP